MKEEILKRVDLLAEKLDTTAQFLFGLYVKQAGVAVIQDIIGMAIGIGLIIGGYFLMRSHQAHPPGRFDVPVPAIFAVLFVSLGVIIVGVNALTLPTELMNPQYWAFKHILEDIHGQ